MSVPMPGASSTRRTARIPTTTPSGTLIAKIQCHETSVRMPPSSRPMDPPAEATKPKTPMAFPCSFGSGNIITIIPRTTAEFSAPPTPCTKRAAISTSWLGESAQTSEAAVKTAMPMRKIRRWPMRSPMRPASSRKPPKAMR